MASVMANVMARAKFEAKDLEIRHACRLLL